MKPYKILVYIFLSLLALESCKRRENNYKESFDTDSLKKVNKAFFTAMHHIVESETQRYCKAYVVIPNTGCSSCISDAEMLLKTNDESYRYVQFILTNIGSIKDVKIKLQRDGVINPNLFLDKENLFSKGILFSIYPRVYLLNESTIIKAVNVSPYEDGLGALKEHLESN